MGKKIDGFVITALAAAGFYLFYMAAFGSILPAALLTALSCILGRAAFSGARIRREPGRRERKKRAASRVREIARMPESEGKRAIEELLAQAYPGEQAALAADLRVGRFGENDLLRLWRSCAGEEKIVVATTAVAERGALELSIRLESPRVRLLDGEQMARLIEKNRAFGGGAPREKRPLSGVLRRGIARGTARQYAARNIAVGCAMLALYWFSGRLPNLIAGAILLGMGCLGRMRKRAPETLFE